MRTLTMLCVLWAGPLFAATAQGPGNILAADAPRTTHDGNGFIAPAGWSLVTSGAARILQAPESGSRIALIDVGTARDADAAVAAAWALYDADAKWPLKLDSDRARRDGWEQIRSYSYQSASGDPRVIGAQALRHGQRWTVVILDMAEAVFGKRESQVDLVHGRLWPKGYAPESFAGRQAHVLDDARIDTLKKFVEDARVKFDVPGVAIGIVQHGKVVFAGGFGVRESGKADKIDAGTLFMIASNNKALTTLMLAKQVDAGRFGWDTPVTALLPGFTLGDASTTRQVQVRHLVCACTGMPRQDMEMVFESEHASPDTIMATLATMQPTSAFGELYQYSNAMAAAGGFAGGHVLHPQLELGAAYDRAMQALVFDPLNMRATTFDFSRALAGNYATPHALDGNGINVPIGLGIQRAAIPSRPDGGAWSNVDDMLRYVQMELAGGALPDGTRYIDKAVLQERIKQQVATGNGTGYGMGLKLDRNLGTLVVNHGGSEAGYRSDMVWLPEHDVGAVILTNADSGTSLRYPFRRRLLELLFDGKPEAEENVAVQSRRLKQMAAVEREALRAPADPKQLDRLATRYRNAALGDIAVTRRGAAFWFDFGNWQSEITTREKDGATVFVTVSPGVDGFEFALAGTPDKPTLTLGDEQHEYVFVPVE